MSSRRLQSCLYECQVMHHRFAPREHRFLYRIFLFAIDLDELEALPGRLALFSLNRGNLFSFQERDFLPTDEALHNPAPTNPVCHAMRDQPGRLKDRVIAYVARHGVDLGGGRVVLVTLPRVAGYLFNPVSFYFCYDRNGTPVAAVTEVTNTFKEMKPYFIGANRAATQPTAGSRQETDDSPESAASDLSPVARRLSPDFQLRTPKHFYVSPYSDVDVAFDFRLRAPGERLSVQIDDYVGDTRLFTSTLTGPRRELTTTQLPAWFTLKYPLITLKIISLIHWHAFRLWLKRVPWFAKAARAGDQRGLYRPHASLTRGPATEPTAEMLSTEKTGNY